MMGLSADYYRLRLELFIDMLQYQSAWDILTEGKQKLTALKGRVKVRKGSNSKARSVWIKRAEAEESELPWYRVLFLRGKPVSMVSFFNTVEKLKAPTWFYLVSGGVLLGAKYGYMQLLLDYPELLELVLRDMGFVLESYNSVSYKQVKEEFMKGIR